MHAPTDRMFARAAAYRAMSLRSSSAIRERPAGDTHAAFSERHLRCVWADPSLRPVNLTTMRGETVFVESPGTWNLEAGPDFLDATLLIGPEQRRLVGDAEIHFRPSDWNQHNHGHDPAYRRVIAHVTWHPGTLQDGALPSGAVEISLRDPVRANPRFAFEAVDVTSYPFAANRSGRSPCAESLAGWNVEDRVGLLDSAGQERLRIKAARLAEALAERNDPDQVLHEELCCALGYKHNRAPFRSLAARLPVEMLRNASAGNAVSAYALMAGVAGLLPDRPPAGADEAARQFVRQLWDCWWKQESTFGRRTMPRSSWRLAGSRPHNQPLRRMAVAAALAVAPEPLDRRLSSLQTTKPKAWFRSVAAIFNETDAAFPFWQGHLGLAGKGDERVALLGPERVAAIITNIVIPFLAARGARIEPLLDLLPPESDNILVRRTAHALFGHDHNPVMYRHGLAQQGLIQIAHDFCLNARMGCPDCGLAAAVRGADGGMT
jgi:hypothetical protein